MRPRGLLPIAVLLLAASQEALSAPRPVRTEYDRVKLDVRRKARGKEARVRSELAGNTPDGSQALTAGQQLSDAQAAAESQAAAQRRSMAGQTNEPAAVTSSLAPWTAPYTGVGIEPRDFYDFSNVMLRNDSLIFFQSSAAGADGLPQTLRLSRYERQVELPIHVYTAANASAAPVCRHWAERPGLLFSDPGWLNNFNEFFATTLMPLFQTASMVEFMTPEHMQELLGVEATRDTGDFDAAKDRLLARLFSKVQHGRFQLISGRPSFFGSPWSYHVKFLTADTTLLTDMQDGVCFKRLVASEDAALRYLYERVYEMRDPGYVAYRASWLFRFQDHVFAAEKLQAMIDHEYNWWLPEKTRNTTKKPQLAFITRSLAARRAVLNEEELLAYIRANWDVDVVSTSFGGPLREAITLMQSTEVLIGMHGAGLTNAFWMRPGAVMVQLFPYGWQLETGEIIRTGLSRDMPLGLNGSYFQWVNPNAEDSYFQQHSFERAALRWPERTAEWGPQLEFREHPTPDMPRPKDWDPMEAWVYADTKVDLTSIAPVLEQAMQAAGVQKKASSGSKAQS